MLTADLVNARRRGGELRLVSLDSAARASAIGIAEALVAAATSRTGGTRDELLLALSEIDVLPKQRRLRDGLVKLIEDLCEFDVAGDLDPEAVRRDVFTRASAARASVEMAGRFDRAAVLAEVARLYGRPERAVEGALFADLRGEHRLVAFAAPKPEALIAAYERAQAQAVLLRAVKVSIEIRDASAMALRALFRKLKFLRLLHVIERTVGGHRVVIDGPFSLFESVTKYGLQLALALPALDGCGTWHLEADVRWGKERVPLVFRLNGREPTPARDDIPALPSEVQALADGFEALRTPWRARPNTEILELPGIGLSVPDLVFERQDQGRSSERVFLEVMGYWSREAVWRRVELIRAGLKERILFAVSSKLRVSEEVLDEELPGALYVYKQSMSARTVAERLEQLAGRAPPPRS